jgi:hypothetical protein
MISASEASTVLDRIGALQDEVIDTVVRAVRIPSVNPSYPGQSYDDVVGGEADVARLLAEQYRSCGATIDTFAVAPGRENAVGVVEGTGGGRSLILTAMSTSCRQGLSRTGRTATRSAAMSRTAASTAEGPQT